MDSPSWWLFLPFSDSASPGAAAPGETGMGVGPSRQRKRARAKARERQRQGQPGSQGARENAIDRRSRNQPVATKHKKEAEMDKEGGK